MIRTFVWSKEKLIENVPLNQLSKYLRDKAATVWVDLQAATDPEFAQMQEVFSLHPLTIEDAKKSIELPKIDVFDKYIFVVLHSVASNTPKNHFEKREIDFFLGNNFLVTVHVPESPGVNHVIEKFRANKRLLSKRADFLMYEVIDYFVDMYFPMLEHWEEYVEELESMIIINKHPKDVLKDILSIKREVIQLKKSIAPQRDVINRLARRDFPYIRQLTSVYMKDVYDHIMRVYSELEIQRDIIGTAFEAYTSTISNKMASTSNKMNQVMQKLTVIATIFMPLTFLAGVYGMNFKYFPEITWRYGYLLFWIAVVIIGIFMFFFFRKRRWM